MFLPLYHQENCLSRGGSVARADFSDSRASPKLRHDHAGNYTEVRRAAHHFTNQNPEGAPSFADQGPRRTFFGRWGEGTGLHPWGAELAVPHPSERSAAESKNLLLDPLRKGWDTTTLNRGSSYSLIPSPYCFGK